MSFQSPATVPCCRQRPKCVPTAMVLSAPTTFGSRSGILAMAMYSSSPPRCRRLLATRTPQAEARCSARISLAAVLPWGFRTAHSSCKSTSTTPPLPPSTKFSSRAFVQSTFQISAGRNCAYRIFLSTTSKRASLAFSSLSACIEARRCSELTPLEPFEG